MISLRHIGSYIFDRYSTLRPLVISRKNMLSCGNHEAAKNTAIICSLLGSCKERGVNPREWLNDVISKLPYYLAPKSDKDLKEQPPNMEKITGIVPGKYRERRDYHSQKQP